MSGETVFSAADHMKPVSASESRSTVQAPASGRILSVDALRGFDMFWIVGGEWIIQALKEFNANPVTNLLAEQLDHVNWAGFHFYDLIFPMFVFVIGVSLVFSLSRIIEQEGRRAALQRIVRRAVLLYLIGILYYGGFSTHMEQIRLLGVLQRLAICYLCAGLAFCFLKPRGLVVLCAGLLLGYWAVMTFVPVPGGTAGNFAEGQNLANYVDRMWLPWRKWDGDHDPEGLLSTLPAIANCLLGVFAGLLLRNGDIEPRRKVNYLLAAGAACLVAGYLWSWQFPIIKKILTSSFVLVAGGWSTLLLGAFYLVIDVWKYQRWTTPFVWIGTNAITIYLLHELIDFKKLAARFVGGDLEAALNHVTPGLGSLLVVLVAVALTFAVVRFLYQRRVFLRL